MGLIEWLRAQLDEDERVARLAADRYVERGPYSENPGRPFWPLPSVAARFRDADEGIAAGLTLIKMFDPARVLREVEAKRRLLDEYAAAKRLLKSIHGDTEDHKALRYRWFTVQVLATAYSDRPGYLDEWRP